MVSEEQIVEKAMLDDVRRDEAMAKVKRQIVRVLHPFSLHKRRCIMLAVVQSWRWWRRAMVMLSCPHGGEGITGCGECIDAMHAERDALRQERDAAVSANH